MASAIFSGAWAADDDAKVAGTGDAPDAEALGLGLGLGPSSGAAFVIADGVGTSLGKVDGDATSAASGAADSSEEGC